MKAIASNVRIGELISNLNAGKLIPNPDFQRRLVWSNNDKSEFIKTILEGYPFPEIFTAKGETDTKTGQSVIWLVDGQQRITTINEYFSGDVNFKGVPAYQELTEKDKVYFLDYGVSVRDLGSVSLEEVKEIFKRINATSYNLNPMEVNNAFYNGPLKQLAAEIASNDFFDEHKVFTPNDVRRMKDTLYILNIIITFISDYYSGDTKVEEFLQAYNNSFPREKEYAKEALSVLDFIDTFEFDKKCRVWNKADFFTLAIELHRHLYKNNLDLNIKTAKKRLQEFYSKVDEAGKAIVEGSNTKNPDLEEHGEYYNAALQGTNSKKNRIARGRKISKILELSV